MEEERKENGHGEENIFKMLELPDILSVLNALLGFSAILLVAFRAGSAEWEGATASLKDASLLILIAAAVDGFDGLVARRFSHSNLGKYLDALADFLSFGAATAVLLYFFVFSALSNTTANIAHAILTLNAAICGAYVASGMLRLARFLELPNAAEEASERAVVMLQKLQKLQKSQSKNEYFVGFPITGSAVIIASFILSSPLLSSHCGCCTTTASSTTAPYSSFAAVIPLLLLVTLLSILMPSRVKYKKIRHRSLAFVLAFSLVLVLFLRFLADSLLAYPALFVFALSFAYLLSPLFRRHPFR